MHQLIHQWTVDKESTHPPKHVHAVPYWLSQRERDKLNLCTGGQSTSCPHFHPKLVRAAMLTASTVNQHPTPLTLTPRDRQFLIAGLIGEYQYLCHDDAEIDDMTPAEHHAVLIHYSDAELLEDSDLIESPYETAEEFYDTHSSYVPVEYQVP